MMRACSSTLTSPRDGLWVAGRKAGIWRYLCATLQVLDAIGRLREGAEPRITEVSFPVPVEQTFELHAINVSEKSAAAITHVLLFWDVTQAVRAKTMRVNFVANASHELRSPLAALLGFVETIKESAADVPDAQKQFLDIMEREAQRMRRLIDDLLSRSGVEANELVRPRELIDISIALRGAIALMWPDSQNCSLK